LDIIKLVEKKFLKKFDLKLSAFLNKKEINHSNSERLFIELQEEVKTCKEINDKFLSFLIKLGFREKNIFKDQYSLRYSPAIGEVPYGKLTPARLHRDTWGSNIFSQINFWFPIHNTSEFNSIYIVPSYFKKKIKNNSKNWSFEKYKKKKKYYSVPYTNQIINDKDKLYFSLKKGSIICFSGNHLHASLQNDDKRVNLETRIVYQDGNDNYVPLNIDSYSQVVKKNWFVNSTTKLVLD
jgi:hypothetical protein